ncbi:type I toxin-antitoxin system SymE family toxin [Xanthomonas sp. SS]|uniref:SymE family type I addiction module toxin n=1 Tax=Xanthomonas sp. SS TaxID=2724122 RepID=UPI00163A361A|nr:SymE family type I addiction module toxin [Xanthomonas sp. SS]QNH15039.1 type I toxin-antitoxin system SymE family toxin [Xanthomonas sp. SS]
MRKPPSPTAAASRKRAPRHTAQCRDWTIVEPTLTPMLTPEQIAAELAAEEARTPRAPRRPRPPQRCKMGYGYYPASNQVVPSLRLRGRWLEQLGFAIGSTLRIEVRDGALVVRIAGEE